MGTLDEVRGKLSVSHIEATEAREELMDIEVRSRNLLPEPVWEVVKLAAANLAKAKIRHVLIGTAALAAQGVNVAADDIDFLCDDKMPPPGDMPGTWESITKKQGYSTVVVAWKINGIMVDCVTEDKSGSDWREPYLNAEPLIIDGVRVAKGEDVIAIKRTANRDKDRKWFSKMFGAAEKREQEVEQWLVQLQQLRSHSELLREQEPASKNTDNSPEQRSPQNLVEPAFPDAAPRAVDSLHGVLQPDSAKQHPEGEGARDGSTIVAVPPEVRGEPAPDVGQSVDLSRPVTHGLGDCPDGDAAGAPPEQEKFPDKPDRPEADHDPEGHCVECVKHEQDRIARLGKPIYASHKHFMAVVNLHQALEKVEGSIRYLKDDMDRLAAANLRFALHKMIDVLVNLSR
jgi:hypothetical protein